MIELVMVIAIVGILTVTGLSGYRTWQQHVLLINATDELKSALNLAQTKAIAAAQSNNWGVHLATSSYIIFPGSFYDENNPDNQSRDLSGIVITNLDVGLIDGAGGFTRDAIFNKYTGNTANTGNLILAPASRPSYTKTISIDANGQIQ
jgi:Tfp pilus assembly protein FimT